MSLDAGGPDPYLRRIVAGKYCVVAPLGAGGMGRVYRAMHLGLGEVVAIKFLNPMFAAVEEVRMRFRREAMALARLRHPSIVTVLDYGEEDGQPYIVMELVAGTTLFEIVLRRRERLAIDRVARIYDQILEVLELVHGTGIVHRDLKLDNVMLVGGGGPAETAKVLDFGLAHVELPGASRLTETGTVRGTPHYMSPEQCRGQGVGPPTDLYAVGVMLYETLAGQSPFDAKDPVQLMAQHLYVEPAPPSEAAPSANVTPGMDALVLRLLAKNAGERPTAGELRAMLRETVAGLDEKTQAAKSELERARVGALTRVERAIGAVAAEAPADAAVEPPLEGTVLLWGLGADRAAELATALGMSGLRTRVAAGSELPASAVDATTRAVVLADAEDVLARMRLAAAAAAPRRLPVLVLGVQRAERTTELVRDGVADVAHVSVGLPDLAKKVRRLVKRGR